MSTRNAVVYFADANVSYADADASLPAKFKRILAKFDLKKITAGDYVPIKIHLGGSMGYTTIHPLFIKLLVDAIKDVGGKPFVVEGSFWQLETAAARGYTSETLGCPIVAAGGPYGTHVIDKKIGYRSLDSVGIFGAIWDAPCLINLSHVKGHGACAYGGACKNIAMGCIDKKTRSKIHSLEGGIKWDKDRCIFCGKCEKICDREAIEIDKKGKTLQVFYHNCRYCRHCISACPQKALSMPEENGFIHFQEGMALTTKAVLDSFEPSRVLHINILLNVTMFCDCWGFSSPSIVPDIGIMASHDIVAVEKACLDSIKYENFIKGSLIGNWKLIPGKKHLLEMIFAKDPYLQIESLEQKGVGTQNYTIKEVK